MTRCFLSCVLLLLGFTVFAAPVEGAVACTRQLGLQSVAQQCRYSGDDVMAMVATSASTNYEYRLRALCKPGDRSENCQVRTTCKDEDGQLGSTFVVLRRDTRDLNWDNLGTSCLTADEAGGLRIITSAMVRREMERLSWPAAELEVQPPDGQTLINFDTNFFTRNTTTTTQTVTLLGQQVTIEARPTSYRWHFGDGESMTTGSPGAPYPALDVTHDYADPGQVQPSVDTVYRGRYRINGDAWQPIPGSLTVSGEPVTLRVRSASPHLVGATH